MKVTRIRRPTTAEPADLSTLELLAEHERVFGPLTPQAKRRLRRAAESLDVERWETPDSLAA